MSSHVSMPPEGSGHPPASEAHRSPVGQDELLREALDRVHHVLDDQARWRLLLDAVVAMAAELSLDGVLDRIVQVAGRLVGARFAALGVLSASPERRLRTFVHHGFPEGLAEQIGHPPIGQGLLGVIIDRPEPLRLHDIAAHPASSGFPPGHPPMHSFLGVPVRIRDQVFGNLYLTEKEDGGDFSQQDQDIAVALAAAAGVVIENTRLYEEAVRRENWLAATAEITSLLAGSTSGQEALQAVADRAREVAGADVSWIVAGDAKRYLSLQVVSGVDIEALTAVPLDESLSLTVARTGVPTTVESLAATRRTASSELKGWPDLGPAIIVPLRNAANIEGVLALAWTPEHADGFYEVDAGLPASFAEQAGLALQVAKHSRDEQRLAVFEDRDRIGRDLHDLVIQRLFAVGLSLQSMSQTMDRPVWADRLDRAVDDLDMTIKDIRRTIFELGSMDEAADIQSEATRAVHRTASSLGFRPGVVFEGPVRTAVTPEVATHLLAVLGEALSNVVRHAEASTLNVTISAGDHITLLVVDNGRGFPEKAVESGLRNMRERAELLGGRCVVTSVREQGTTVHWSVPRA